MQSVTQRLENNNSNSKHEAARLGKYLIEVKEQLPHGRFTVWVENNCSFSPAQAQRYMRVSYAKVNYPKEYAACNSINEANAIKRVPKPKPKHTKHQTLIQRISYNLGLMFSRFPISS